LATSAIRRPARRQRRLILGPRRRLQHVGDLLQAEDDGDLPRLADEDQRAAQIRPLQGDAEEEPQCRHRAVHRRRPHPALGLVQLEAAKVLRRRRVRRPAEEDGERPDVADIIGLRLLDELADGHVFDHPPA
jgi:hypothetical protein